MAFNENSRVKIPALLHLMKLGYQYIPLSQRSNREDTNIFEDIFVESLLRINPDTSKEDILRLLDEISLELDFEDLGRKFYQRLTATSGIKLIDFKNFNNNSFHITPELTAKNGDEEFRPDITILINGMPLAFVEVKKPHNKEGVIAERSRINSRFKNKHFRRFANITQLMVFSNNMEYEDGIVEPVFGAFYATSAYSDLHFNYFREDPEYPVRQKMGIISDAEENTILKDNNLLVIKHSPEFKVNKEPHTPTHRILTSLFSKERLAFILRYAIAYVEEESGLQKHIMRYPQIFATMAITHKLNEGKTKGIIWHTQGSGKTALAFFNVKHLTDYYQKQNTIPKFYFIVDRIDLLVQASTEFSNRGLKVNQVNSRQEFIDDLQVVGAIHNDSGQAEITVVNIQKFSEDSTIIKLPDYDINTQRIYFLDEAHRSYNPKGNYLANLINSDRNAVIIALTGTPLLREVAKEYDSKILFGNYIHKYYYNSSIADGYTLRLIREEIEGSFKMEMKEVMERIKLLKGDIKTSDVYAEKPFAQGLLDYITTDLIAFKDHWKDETLGGMVVCDSSKQAKMLFQLFEEQYGKQETDAEKLPMVAEPQAPYGKRKKDKLTAALILHDENDKLTRKELIKAYKGGKIDILFVYNMLLTGFDAKRLKKLYLARVIQDHNLLQTLTRVNRPYKTYQYGYVVDFADISKAFDRTNQLYFKELQDELGDEMEMYSNLFKSETEIRAEIDNIKETLFHYNTENREIFSQQISQLTDKTELLQLVKTLRTAKELKNLIALQGLEGLGELVDFEILNRLLIEAQSRLDSLNFVESLANAEETQNLLSAALEDIIFQFIKVGEEELKLADELKDQLRKTREALQNNFDQNDPVFVNLREELERIFKKKNLTETTQSEMVENLPLLRKIYNEAKELNRKNALLKAKYNNDEKYVRIHKRLTEKGQLNAKEIQLHRALMQVKNEVDNRLEGQEDYLNNEALFDRYLVKLVAQKFVIDEKLDLDADTRQNISTLIGKEYFQLYNNRI
ncbi:type I restriction endonuclease [Elizabethkingia anophelis]|uniref:type I restriction endonuclease subunit R n=1 Tax=Elizabethkingia anophelis TaxID=1117645 RepID=UPI000994D691|nr:type I restriction endonuclease [Elizabethkingia anophelis]AQW98549.1 restriction endonuclease subunit R [Elizabethkingia anophelis]ASV78406.1 type I restriction endonuclease subunit R [Elizabethkingia anophelis]MCL1647762.1 type I restriction endonuclease [Elizabethkingia anophelis]MCL1683156.1 type I restriction endonuclease [Elizabethkingia anophelis]MDV2493878.1 type I restriction endonuclease subunit R [Elizabethkingia anophelis]